MIPYEQLAAALERRAANHAAAAPAPQADAAGLEDNTLSGAPAGEHPEYEVGDILSDDEAS